MASALALAAPALGAPAPFHANHAGAGAKVALVSGPRPHAAASITTVAGPTLYVSKTGHDTGTCRLNTHPCLTITYALGQAPSDSASTISVGAGTYDEQLTITKNVSIKGAARLSDGSYPTIIEPSSVAANDTDPYGPQLAIVDFASGVTAGKLANIEVNGSQAQNSITNCSQDYVGVLYHDASGALTTDHVTNIIEPLGFFGCQNGLGVYAETDSGATASNVSMTGIQVDKYDKNGITCIYTNCTISKAKVIGLGPIPNSSNPQENTAQNGIQISDAAGSVTGSTVSGNSYTSPQYCPTTGACNGGTPSSTYFTATGILVIDASNVNLTGNTVTANDTNVYEGYNPAFFGETGAPAQGAWVTSNNLLTKATNDSGTAGNGSETVPFGGGYGDGLDIDGATNATVQLNSVYSNPEYGIGVFATSNSLIGGTRTIGTTTTLAGNKTGKAGSANGDGIYVGDPSISINPGVNSANNTISNNSSSANSVDGILADASTLNNTFSKNTLQNNVRFDAEDQSSGGGTGGTANTWSTNHCQPTADSSPTALCTAP